MTTRSEYCTEREQDRQRQDSAIVLLVRPSLCKIARWSSRPRVKGELDARAYRGQQRSRMIEMKWRWIVLLEAEDG